MNNSNIKLIKDYVELKINQKFQIHNYNYNITTNNTLTQNDIMIANYILKKLDFKDTYQNIIKQLDGELKILLINEKNKGKYLERDQSYLKILQEKNKNTQQKPAKYYDNVQLRGIELMKRYNGEILSRPVYNCNIEMKQSEFDTNLKIVKPSFSKKNGENIDEMQSNKNKLFNIIPYTGHGTGIGNLDTSNFLRSSINTRNRTDIKFNNTSNRELVNNRNNIYDNIDMPNYGTLSRYGYNSRQN